LWDGFEFKQSEEVVFWKLEELKGKM